LFCFSGQVLGRKKIGVKVCSCPRRDMLKEEEIEKKRINGVKTFNKRTTLIEDSEIPGKIPKTNSDNTEEKIYELPSVCNIIILINFNIQIKIFIKKNVIITMIFSYLF